MRICYFGDYQREYNRSRVLLKGLSENGVQVLECWTDKVGLDKYLDLYRKHKELKGQYDVMFVAQSFTSRLVWLAKIISRKPIVWDIFYSSYDKYCFDSKVISPWSARGWYHWLREVISAQMCDVGIFETNAYGDYFSKEFHCRRDKIIRVLTGADDDIFYESKVPVKNREDRDFIVHFHGNFIPVQGTQYIIKAAKILESHKNIRFRMIGSGQLFNQGKKLVQDLDLKNIDFLGKKPYEEIVHYLHEADINLGNFGDTGKTTRVVATKVYEAMAARVAVISADVPSMREIFSDGENIILCNRADPDDLAKKIMMLKKDGALRRKIADNGFAFYYECSTPNKIAEQLIKDLESLIKF